MSRNNKKAAKKPPKTSGKSDNSGKWIKIILGSSVGLAALLVFIALILDQFPVHHRFSIETSSKEIIIHVENKADPKPFKISGQPYLTLLSISAQNLTMETSEFVIQETNEPKLSGIKKADILKATSKTSAYYQVENIGDTALPTEFYCSSDIQKAQIIFRFGKDGEKYLLKLQLPAGKTTAELKTKQINLLIHDSKIEFGKIAADTKGNRIKIKGKPHKIKIDIDGSNPAKTELYTKKGEAYELKSEPNPPANITGIEFRKASSDTKIFRDKEDVTPIKEKFPSNPTIKIKGSIKSIEKLQIADNGIETTMVGEYVTIEIAETVMENTALDEATDFLEKIWKFVKNS
jgi:hypothetical protein